MSCPSPPVKHLVLLLCNRKYARNYKCLQNKTNAKLLHVLVNPDISSCDWFCFIIPVLFPFQTWNCNVQLRPIAYQMSESVCVYFLSLFYTFLRAHQYTDCVTVCLCSAKLKIPGKLRKLVHSNHRLRQKLYVKTVTTKVESPPSDQSFLQKMEAQVRPTLTSHCWVQ